jgi:hypothetical protein
MVTYEATNKPDETSKSVRQWYVDDLMAVSHIAKQQKDSDIVDTSVQQLLGEGLIAKNKSFHDRKLEFLG